MKYFGKLYFLNLTDNSFTITFSHYNFIKQKQNKKRKAKRAQFSIQLPHVRDDITHTSVSTYKTLKNKSKLVSFVSCFFFHLSYDQDITTFRLYTSF